MKNFTKLLHQPGLSQIMAKPAKVRHVLRSKQSRKHGCHWPGCKKQVPPAMWGCRPHWFALPKALRDRIWATYAPKQEETQRPSREYVAAARAIRKWIKEFCRACTARVE